MSAEAPQERRRPRRRLLAAALLAPPVVLALSVAGQVDDWSRDLTTNVARTDPRAPDPALRPLRTARSRGEVAEALGEVAAGLSGWERLAVEEEGERATIVRLVRTTPLLRFRDDVTVRVEDLGQARAIAAESRSRVGKGDLGQNPRNLRALLTALRERLGDAEPAAVDSRSR